MTEFHLIPFSLAEGTKAAPNDFRALLNFKNKIEWNFSFV